MNANIRQHALNILSRREHSEGELRRKLKAKGHSIDDIESLLACLNQEGLQSDRRYIEAYTRYRCNRGFGPRSIAASLRHAGVDEALIEGYFCTVEDQWDEALASLWKRKFKQLPQDAKARAKQYRFLLQRGFEPDRVQALLWDK